MNAPPGSTSYPFVISIAGHANVIPDARAA
jgi:hypothetical protein